MTNDLLTEELKSRFRKGETVAGLIRFASGRLGGDVAKHDWAQAVRTAFRLRVYGWNILDTTDSFGYGKHRDEILTSIYLGMILQNRPQWDAPRSERPECWYDSIPWEPTPDHMPHRETTPAMLAALAEALQRRVANAPAELPETRSAAA